MTTPAPARAEAGGTPMIALRNLTKAFGSKVALRGVNLTVMPGESMVIFGPNGAGKSTMIRILCALSRPTSGTVQIGGLDLRKHAEGIRVYLGVVSHAPLLYDSLTAEENLHFFGRLYGMSAPDERIAEMLQRVGLHQRRKDLVRNYSRGMVQRLAIARALLHDPEILLLDEPDTGLDPQAAEMLHRLLEELSGRTAMDQRRRTIVTVTHNLERGLAVADRLVIMANGRVAYEGMTEGMSPETLRGLYDQHAGGSR
jgi:ABC-type multidrug transport system ATPase subunit